MKQADILVEVLNKTNYLVDKEVLPVTRILKCCHNFSLKLVSLVDFNNQNPVYSIKIEINIRTQMNIKLHITIRT